MFAQALRRGLTGLANITPGGIARHLSTDSHGARAMRPLVNRLLPHSLTIVTVRDGKNRGLRIPIYPRSEKYYWTGTYESELQETLWSLLAPGGVFWDVGAHLGFFSSLASRRVGPSGRVIAVEPFSDNLARLEAVLALNDAANVDVLPLAILEKAGDAVLVPAPASSMGSVVPGPVTDGVPVSVQSLDGLLQLLPAPDVVKIDVEGAELDVLRGGLRLVTDTNSVLIVEFTDAEVVAQARALLPGHAFEALSDRHWLLRREMTRTLPSEAIVERGYPEETSWGQVLGVANEQE
jgi:FkbM family methyltransferase